MKKYLIGMFACAALFACSSDEVDEQTTPVNKDQAYMTIRLRNANSTRGEVGNPEFVYGSADENAVNTAEFYFYDAAGNQTQYVSKVLSWNAGTETNVEEFADATIVLEGLTQTGTPNYVVAVLNGPVGKYKGTSLTALQSAIVDSYLEGNNFIMTNSTYNNGDADSKYFATALVAKNFLNEKPTTDQLTQDNAVQIYVERVAAKVEVALKTGTDGVITLTPAEGEPKYEIDGEPATIQIKVLNWGLNAINKTSYVEKNVPEWTYTLGNWDWTAGDHRSYWAKSPNYNGGVYPASYESTVDAGTATSDVNTEKYALKYVSWNDLDRTFSGDDTYAYCLENTNTKDALTTGNFFAATTHVLLKAQVVGGKDLIRYDGQLYSAEGFVARVLNLLNMKAYKVTFAADGVTPTAYAQIDVDDMVVNTYDGDVTLSLTEEAKAAKWSSTTGTYTDIDAAAIDADLKSLDVDADYYTDGMMYYCIPIEHLRGGKYSIPVGSTTAVVEEADYGVVRNHWYKLTVNSIGKLGTAVYDPEEEIVPVMETPTYYVGASVNILSWHIVNQNVDL